MSEKSQPTIINKNTKPDSTLNYDTDVTIVDGANIANGTKITTNGILRIEGNGTIAPDVILSANTMVVIDEPRKISEGVVIKSENGGVIFRKLPVEKPLKFSDIPPGITIEAAQIYGRDVGEATTLRVDNFTDSLVEVKEVGPNVIISGKTLTCTSLSRRADISGVDIPPNNPEMVR